MVNIGKSSIKIPNYQLFILKKTPVCGARIFHWILPEVRD